MIVFARKVARTICVILLIALAAVTALKWVDPVSSSVMIQHNIMARLQDRPKADYRWVDWQGLSPQLPLAVVASEDQRFPLHRGIDFTELKRVIDRGGRRGASTISQQVAKNMFLWQGRSYLRKIMEAPLALYIDLVWGKRRVLEVYLNVAYFGGNTYGVGAASAVYFDKTAREINRYEAARLAAVLPSPRRYSVTNASDYIVKRQNWILGQMKQLGGINYIKNL